MVKMHFRICTFHFQRNIRRVLLQYCSFCFFSFPYIAKWTSGVGKGVSWNQHLYRLLSRLHCHDPHLPKISLVSVFETAPRALTLELNTICLRHGITSQWCFFFCSTRGHLFPVAVIPLWGCFCFGTFCFVFGLFFFFLYVAFPLIPAAFCPLWWTVEVQHFMASDISEHICLISICWHIISLLVATHDCGVEFSITVFRLHRNMANVRWKLAGNTEEFQPAAAAKAISAS